MYNSKYFHAKAVDISGKEDKRYITIKDPYVDRAVRLPARWKKKQFECDRIPQNAGDGYFGLNGKSFKYVSEPYMEMQLYVKSQPLAKRKQGFGTRDAKRRDEYCNTISTEQLRETLRKEMVLMQENRDPKKEAELMAKVKAQEAAESEARGAEPTFLYDIGKKKTTQFNAKLPRDSYYNYKLPMRGDHQKRMGSFRTMSQAIGAEAWTTKYNQPRKSAVHATKTFYDASHLQVPGF